MPSPKQVLSIAKTKKIEPIHEVKTGAIHELVSKVFTTRNLLHFAHWATNSYAAHMALGELYDEVVDQIDEIVEVYQGKFGLLSGLSTMAASVPSDILAHIVAEQEWVCENRENIANNVEPICNLLDELDAAYLKVIYKLKNLK